ncbi:hypothetical protein DVH24_035728 [Malus domestica]|uniref:Uncharacterized protein n=1 Tax=Malus domestica TaxID=3750 RepID=A0A498JND9_MALDO|nr:hypothetical protein DVH24_035728 [Malus domestica]
MGEEECRGSLRQCRATKASRCKSTNFGFVNHIQRQQPCRRSLKLFADFDHGGQNDELKVVQGVEPHDWLWSLKFFANFDHGGQSDKLEVVGREEDDAELEEESEETAEEASPLSTGTEHSHRAQPLNTATERSH